MSNQTEKPRLNLVVLGHVGAGKSTTLGHLLYKCGKISNFILEHFENESKVLGKSSFKFAWILDKLKLEREKGLTIDISTWEIESNKYKITLIDTPGHKNFIKNTICGITQGDCGVFVVSCIQNEIEPHFIPALGQIRDQVLMAFTFGIKQLIILINKMDDPSVDFSESCFNEVKEKLFSFLKKIGYNDKNLIFIPISAWKGDNLVERSSNITWYVGPVLFEAFDHFIEPRRQFIKPLRIVLRDIYKIGGIGLVPVGKIEAGHLTTMMEVTFAPGNITHQVKSIHINYQPIFQANPGDRIAFNIKGGNIKNFSRGQIVGDAKHNPPVEVESFLAQVMILNHPGPIKKGYTPILCCHSCYIACRLEEIHNKIDRHTGSNEGPITSLKKGDSALVRFVPLKPLSLERFFDYPPLGRFLLRDLSRPIGVGIVKDVTNKFVKK